MKFVDSDGKINMWKVSVLVLLSWKNKVIFIY